MARSKWKLIYFSKNIWNLLFKIKLKKKFNLLKKIIIFNRNSSIPSSFSGLNVFIHKGNFFKKITLLKYYSSLKFGEFSFTKKPFKYPLISKKKR